MSKKKKIKKESKKIEAPIVVGEHKTYKTRISFLVHIDADDKELLDEAIDDIKFHFKNIRTSGISVSNGKGYNWRVVKQSSSDVIVKIIKEVK